MIIDSPLGEVVAEGSQGLALYVSLEDPPGHSNCTEECAQTWIPVSARDAFAPDREPTGGPGIEADLIGTINRNDGDVQLTYNKRPLYAHSGSLNPGELNGQGVDNNWFVISPAGEPILE